jgi:formylglycine-generating enzyme required for sulfatase activity
MSGDVDSGFTQIYENGDLNVIYANWSTNGYRLPTEAEWEKAARGGLSGNRFPWGNVLSEGQANYYGYPAGTAGYDAGPAGYSVIGSIGGTSPATSPVGSFAPNGYGLYDMAGDVAEWCWDWYAMPPYPAGSAYLGGSNPTGAGPGSTGNRVTRGGEWEGGASIVRSAYRFANSPGTTGNYIGFRCVRRQ